MPRNGSGTYSLPSGNPVVTGTTISSTTHNSTMSDLATAMTASIAKDGQTVPSANLPMGGFKHTNVASATARTEYCTAGQAQDNTFDWLSSVSGTDTITATAPISMAAYAEGQCFRFVAAGANTGAVTLNLNSLGAKSVTKNGTTALVAGDIPSGAVAEVTYDGTRFQLINVGTLLDAADIGVSVQAYDADIPTIAASQAEMEAGTESALRSMSPLRVAQAIASLAPPVAGLSKVSNTSLSAASASGDISITPGVRYLIKFRLKWNASVAGGLSLRFNADSGNTYGWGGVQSTVATGNTSQTSGGTTNSISLSAGSSVPNGGFINGEIEFETFSSDTSDISVSCSSEFGDPNTHAFTGWTGHGKYYGASAISTFRLIATAGDMTGNFTLYQYA